MRFRVLTCLTFTAALILVDIIFFRIQVGNGFTVLFGDQYDGVIEDTLLEHWYNVVTGSSHWSEANYFYPYHKTIGYNDGYFIYGIIYSIYRMIGVDPFLSSEIVNITIKSIGFIAFFVALRRIFNLSFGWALFGAALFTLSHSSFFHAGHAQLLSVSFAPLLALMIWEALEHLRDAHSGKLIGFGVAAGVLFAAWLFTAFYMSWFFVYILVFILISYLVLDRKLVLDTVVFAVRKRWGALLIIGTVTAMALIPFLSVYLSKARETGMHQFSEARVFILGFNDIINVGSTNILFGDFYTWTAKIFCPSCAQGLREKSTGFTPILLIVLGFCFLWLTRRDSNSRYVLTVAIAMATVITWALCFHIGKVTGWHPVYVLFPGAKAIRVISRYQIFLMGPVVALATCYLAHLAQRVPIPIILVICCVLLLGELDSGTVGVVSLDRRKEIELTTVSTAPPADCQSFFVSAATGQTSESLIDKLYPHNVPAMMIAELIHLPTINGLATFTPPDWSFDDPARKSYTEAVAVYTARHSLAGLCRLNLTSKRWESNWRPD